MKKMYESPIHSIPTKICADLDGEILRTINFEYGVNIDKQELIRALEYDRNQYEKGYQDRDSEIVRCEDCSYFEYGTDVGWCCCHDIRMQKYDYCSWAKRKDEEK